MLRIGAGVAKGRRLRTVTGVIRPTGSRVRGSLFDILSSRILNSRVLDLCAGSGSLGLEALSRGARCCLFVANDRRSVRMIKENLDLCGFEGKPHPHGAIRQSRIWLTDAIQGLRHLADHSCSVDIILADPPYGDAVIKDIIQTVGERVILAPGGLLVIEHRGEDVLDSCVGLDPVRRRDIGETTLSFFEADSVKAVTKTPVLPIDLPPPSSRAHR